jgi:hypothetical protein
VTTSADKFSRRFLQTATATPTISMKKEKLTKQNHKAEKIWYAGNNDERIMDAHRQKKQQQNVFIRATSSGSQVLSLESSTVLAFAQANLILH